MSPGFFDGSGINTQNRVRCCGRMRQCRSAELSLAQFWSKGNWLFEETEGKSETGSGKARAEFKTAGVLFCIFLPAFHGRTAGVFLKHPGEASQGGETQVGSDCGGSFIGIAEESFRLLCFSFKWMALAVCGNRPKSRIDEQLKKLAESFGVSYREDFLNL